MIFFFILLVLFLFCFFGGWDLINMSLNGHNKSVPKEPKPKGEFDCNTCGKYFLYCKCTSK